MPQRAYRHDLRCPHCGSLWMPKAGFSRGKQTYRCGECHHRPSPEGNRHYHSPQGKGLAWELYGEGLSIAALSRVLGLTELTALAWIKKVRPAGVELARLEAEQRAERAPEQRAAVISLDKMWTYLGRRVGPGQRRLWIWTAVIEEADGWRWRLFEVGRRNRATLRRLLARLPLAERYCTAPYPVYRALLPAERHQVGKGPQTNRNEATHGVLRRKLNRLAMRTPGYRKSLAMQVDSLALVWLKRGWIHPTGPCQEYQKS